MSELAHQEDYRQLLAAIKQRIQTSQTPAVLAANTELPGRHRDIFAIRQFYALFSPQFEFVPQPVGQIPRRPLPAHTEGTLCPSI